MALPLMRKGWREDLSEEEARKLLEDCCRVLFYRDTRASAYITIGKARAQSCARAPHPFARFWTAPFARRDPRFARFWAVSFTRFRLLRLFARFCAARFACI
eukprot:827859-Pleurochrysis_carterae.AAC.1